MRVWLGRMKSMEKVVLSGHYRQVTAKQTDSCGKVTPQKRTNRW